MSVSNWPALSSSNGQEQLAGRADLAQLQLAMNAIRPGKMVRIGSNGRVVIPEEFRRRLGIKGGTKAAISVTPDGFLLRPITPTYIRSLRGKFRHLPLMETLANDRKRERAL